MHPEVYDHGHLLVPAGFLETARRDAHDSGRLGHPPGQLGDPQHHGAELPQVDQPRPAAVRSRDGGTDRKSTRLNSSHLVISYAVFCLKKKKKNKQVTYSAKVECRM